jgi:hypothetical protein
MSAVKMGFVVIKFGLVVVGITDVSDVHASIVRVEVRWMSRNMI